MSLHNFYIYYRVRAEETERAETAVNALMDEVAARTGIHGRLMLRADDPTTWMEVYEHVAEPEAFREVLEAATQASGLTDLMQDARRHIEHFCQREISADS